MQTRTWRFHICKAPSSTARRLITGRLTCPSIADEKRARVYAASAASSEPCRRANIISIISSGNGWSGHSALANS